MSKVNKTQTIVLVSYSTPLIPACFSKSLYQHMFDNVWGLRSEVEEDIRVVCDDTKSPKYITEIRYQFGNDFSEELADKIGELINEQMIIWLAKSSIDEIVN